MRNPLSTRGRRQESAQKVKRDLSLPGLADLPTPDAGEAIVNAAYDHLLSEVAAKAPRRTVFAVTSSLPGEGRSTVVANLALAAARRGLRALVIDADVRHPLQHRLFNGDQGVRRPGLLDILTGAYAAAPLEATHPTPVAGVRLLPSGELTVSDMAALLGSPTMERFLRSIAARMADVVLVDAPHVLSEEPGRRLLSLADGVLFVVRAGDTDTNRARKALAELARAEARLLGGVYVPAGTFPLEKAVRLPGARPAAPSRAASALENAATTTEIVETAPDMTVAEPNEPEEEPIAPMAAAPNSEENREETTEAAADAAEQVGVDDLEAVLQGWRRREYTEQEGDAEAEATPDAVVAEADSDSPNPVTEESPVDEVPAAESPAAPEPASPPIEETANVSVTETPAPVSDAAPSGFAWPIGASAEAAAPTAESPAPAPSPSTPAPAAAPASGRGSLEVALDMLPTASGEMTLRAATTNAAAVGAPSVALEMAVQMSATKGMRALTPVSGGGDGARIALEASSSDAPDAIRMRLVVGDLPSPAVEATLKPGESVQVRTGSGATQPATHIELSATGESGSVVRVTLAVPGGDITLEIRREAVKDAPADARWKNRLAMYFKD